MLRDYAVIKWDKLGRKTEVIYTDTFENALGIKEEMEAAAGFYDEPQGLWKVYTLADWEQGKFFRKLIAKLDALINRLR